MSRYFTTLEDAVSDAGINAEDWNELQAEAKAAREKAGIAPDAELFTEEEKQEILKFYHRFEEDVDCQSLNSYHYDSDPYGIGGSYSCRDNVSYDDEEFEYEQFQLFIKTLVDEGIYVYIDLDEDKFPEELEKVATLEALRIVWNEI